MLEIKTYHHTVPAPNKDWLGKAYIECSIPPLPNSIKDMVSDIISCAKKNDAYRTRGNITTVYAVAFTGTILSKRQSPFLFYTESALSVPVRRQLLMACYKQERVTLEIGSPERIQLYMSGKVEPEHGHFIKIYGDLRKLDGSLFAKTPPTTGLLLNSAKVQRADMAG